MKYRTVLKSPLESVPASPDLSGNLFREVLGAILLFAAIVQLAERSDINRRGGVKLGFIKLYAEIVQMRLRHKKDRPKKP